MVYVSLKLWKITLKLHKECMGLHGCCLPRFGSSPLFTSCALLYLCIGGIGKDSSALANKTTKNSPAVGNSEIIVLYIATLCETIIFSASIPLTWYSPDDPVLISPSRRKQWNHSSIYSNFMRNDYFFLSRFQPPYIPPRFIEKITAIYNTHPRKNKVLWHKRIHQVVKTHFVYLDISESVWV